MEMGVLDTPHTPLQHVERLLEINEADAKEAESGFVVSVKTKQRYMMTKSGRASELRRLRQEREFLLNLKADLEGKPRTTEVRAAPEQGSPPDNPPAAQGGDEGPKEPVLA